MRLACGARARSYAAQTDGRSGSSRSCRGSVGVSSQGAARQGVGAGGDVRAAGSSGAAAARGEGDRGVPRAHNGVCRVRVPGKQGSGEIAGWLFRAGSQGRQRPGRDGHA